MGSDLFCRMEDAWREQGKILFENDFTYSILSVTPAMFGHALLITKPCVERVDLLDGDALRGYFEARARTYQRLIQLVQGDDLIRFYRQLAEEPPFPLARQLAEQVIEQGKSEINPFLPFMYGENIGSVAGQTVMHAHGQIFPLTQPGQSVEELLGNYFDVDQEPIDCSTQRGDELVRHSIGKAHLAHNPVVPGHVVLTLNSGIRLMDLTPAGFKAYAELKHAACQQVRQWSIGGNELGFNYLENVDSGSRSVTAHLIPRMEPGKGVVDMALKYQGARVKGY